LVRTACPTGKIGGANGNRQRSGGHLIYLAFAVDRRPPR
jgi:hypothetical protein